MSAERLLTVVDDYENREILDYIKVVAVHIDFVRKSFNFCA